MVIDNYLDGGYHVPICHKDLNALLDESSYKIELFDNYSIQSTLGGSDADEDSRIGNAAIFAHVYPNLFLNRYGEYSSIHARRKCQYKISNNHKAHVIQSRNLQIEIIKEYLCLPGR